MALGTSMVYTASLTKQRQRGFSLLEVLISIVIMTFGLLGISGLMVKGISNSTGSDLASRASQSSGLIMDAMRANTLQLSSYDTRFATNATTYASPTSTAESDLFQWKTAVERLPGGQGDIKCNPTSFVCTVSVLYRNCMGTLSQNEISACASNTTTTSNSRTIDYQFRP
jgi:type IV pilus assembly protein PilV